MKTYNSFYTWLTETQLDNDTPIGEFGLTVGKFAQRVKRDARFPRNSHRKPYHTNYMFRSWSDLGLEGVGFSGVMDRLWPMYIDAVSPCIGCSEQSPAHLAWRRHLKEKEFAW